ncbi:hypothetical protein [Desulforamulus aquiferis]|uniref:Uncharacterized protein n=1 Tax=Desulforamulus aquiferis TaxID=1397668 RepID=A0AAW7ZI75_9FIRM|nr:hypothetical protein [Desulforamulus aquiferis]MDO7788875.1 hypothetical protein [Desulforamulus aquiferis]RYD06389.1 hypothetical protein N752_04295 [Desulforamulus aquiferis]
MLTQQLVNGQMTVTTIARYSISKANHYVETFDPFFDAYEQFIFLSTPMQEKLNPSFDLFEQLMCIT